MPFCRLGDWACSGLAAPSPSHLLRRRRTLLAGLTRCVLASAYRPGPLNDTRPAVHHHRVHSSILFQHLFFRGGDHDAQLSQHGDELAGRTQVQGLADDWWLGQPRMLSCPDVQPLRAEGFPGLHSLNGRKHPWYTRASVAFLRLADSTERRLLCACPRHRLAQFIDQLRGQHITTGLFASEYLLPALTID